MSVERSGVERSRAEGFRAHVVKAGVTDALPLAAADDLQLARVEDDEGEVLRLRHVDLRRSGRAWVAGGMAIGELEFCRRGGLAGGVAGRRASDARASTQL